MITDTDSAVSTWCLVFGPFYDYENQNMDTDVCANRIRWPPTRKDDWVTSAKIGVTIQNTFDIIKKTAV